MLEVGDVASRYTMDNMTAWVFGLDVSSVRDPDNEFRRLVLSITGPGAANHLRRLMAWFFRPLLALLPANFSFPGREVGGFMNETVDRLAHAQGDALLQSLLGLKGREILPVNGLRTKPLIMTAEMVTANAFTALLGGTDASSSIITFCLLELALNHEIQGKLREEIKVKAQEQQRQQDED